MSAGARYNTMETLVRAIGALACVMSVLGVVVMVVGAMSPKLETNLPRGLKSPTLAIEFAQPGEVDGILGERKGGDSPMRIKLRRALYGDYFFIAIYWLLFAGMSALLVQRGPSWAVWGGVVAAVCATSGAIFDVVENLSIAALLDAAVVQPEMVRNVASAGFGKWLLVSLSTLILSLVFLRRDWLVLLGALFFVIGLIGIYGILRDPRFVEWSFRLSLAGVVVVAIFFTGWRRKVLDQF